MIREKQLFCKLINVKKTAAELYKVDRRQASKKRAASPVCGCEGKWRAHGKYERNLIDYAEGKVEYGRILVERLRCESCGHTQAVLPDHIVPYSTYSLFFILRILGRYFFKLETVEELCRRYGITPSMLYQWKAVYQAHKEIWLGVLETAETPAEEFIRGLWELADHSTDFGGRFYEKAARSFLQRHRDAAWFRHAVF